MAGRRSDGMVDVAVLRDRYNSGGTELFRRTQGGQTQRARGASSGSVQFSSDSHRASSTARPRTTGSVAGGTQQQSSGPIHLVQRKATSPVPGSRYHPQSLRSVQDLALSDLNPRSLSARTQDDRDSGLFVRRGGQQRGSSSQDVAVNRRLSSDGGRHHIAPPGALGAVLSRLPLLEQGQRHSPTFSIENAELSEYGIAYGVSALRGRRPYMEDEYKVMDQNLCRVPSGPVVVDTVDRASFAGRQNPAVGVSSSQKKISLCSTLAAVSLA